MPTCRKDSIALKTHKMFSKSKRVKLIRFRSQLPMTGTITGELRDPQNMTYYRILGDDGITYSRYPWELEDAPDWEDHEQDVHKNQKE